jgi:ParB-like chromosome segregation protein Spo0J
MFYVIVGNRYRKDFGDLTTLAETIDEHGLLQPIGITEDNVLIFGERRLRAVRDVLRGYQ